MGFFLAFCKFLYRKKICIFEVFFKFLLLVYVKLRFLLIHIISCSYNPKISKKYGAQFFILKYVDEEKKLLDVGCGRGDLTKILAERVASIDAFDASEANIVYAKRYNLSDNIVYYVADANSEVDKLNKQYDVVYLGAVLSFLSDPVGFLKKISRCAGRIIIRETKFDNEIIFLIADDLGVKKSPWREFRKQELLDVLTMANYKILEIFDTYDIYILAVPIASV